MRVHLPLRAPLRFVLGSAVLVALCVATTAAATPFKSAAGLQGSVLRIGLDYTIPHLNPVQTPANAWWANSLAMENLLTIDEHGKLKPWLAQSVTRPNSTTYVYHLRHGVKFWDGNEMTATDVATSLNFYRYPGAATQIYWRSVKNVVAKDKYTVVITLKTPDASFQFQPGLGLGAGIFEKKWYDAHKATFGKPGTLLMGTGPWKYDSLNPVSGIEMSANTRYWGPKPRVQHISIKFFADETSEALAMRAGELDLAAPFDSRAFRATSGVRVVQAPALYPYMLSFNVIEAPWNDIHVRRAAAYAIDRAEIIKALGAPASPLNTIIPPAQLYSIASKPAVDKLLATLPKYPHDIAKGKAEMAQSRYPNGVSADFRTLAEFGFYDMGQVVASQLKQVGINLTVKTIPFTQWLSELFGPSRDNQHIGIKMILPISSTPDPYYEPSFILGTRNSVAHTGNDANYTPPDVDALIKAAIIEQNNAKRLVLYGKILKRVGTDLPYIPLFNTTPNLALVPQFRWKRFNAFYLTGPWALQVTPA
jgi:peptide/nickel transport system substrate-binding protein